MNLCEIIDEANICSGKLAAKWAGVAMFGNTDEKLYFDFLRMNAYIRTLERNQVTFRKVKSSDLKEGQMVDFSSLKKENNVLLLESKEENNCTTVEVCPCLSDSEICKIIEQMKLLCSTCNC